MLPVRRSKMSFRLIGIADFHCIPAATGRARGAGPPDPAVRPAIPASHPNPASARPMIRQRAGPTRMSRNRPSHIRIRTNGSRKMDDVQFAVIPRSGTPFERSGPGAPEMSPGEGSVPPICASSPGCVRPRRRSASPKAEGALRGTRVDNAQRPGLVTDVQSEASRHGGE
jgi:hypothetical protein